MSGMDSLLPCPFCGKTETYVDGSADCTGTPMAGCLHCGAHIPHASRTKAIAAWNRRASQAAPAPSDGLREAARQVVEWFDTVAPQQRGPRIERLRAALTAYPAQDGEPRHG